METLLHLLDILGIVAFAATGALVASQKNMDLFGGIVLAFVTGVGGGTMRDLILGTQAFWVDQPVYIFASMTGLALVYLLLKTVKRVPDMTLNVLDAIGLAVFTLMGTQKALAFDLHPVVAVMMGLLTGCGGGMIRDILANEVPLILTRNKLYATASLSGALLFVATVALHPIAAAWLCVTTVLAIRLCALRFNWRLPHLPQ